MGNQMDYRVATDETSSAQYYIKFNVSVGQP